MTGLHHGGEPLTRRETIKALSAFGIGTGLLVEKTSAADHGEKPGGNKVIAEPARQIPVYADADVVVCGGGPAGIMTAIAAARNGARTLLVERYGFLGGNASMGLPLLTFHNDQHQQIIRGCPQELVDRLLKLGGTFGHEFCPWHTSHVIIEPEKMKLVAQEMCLEAGVKLLLHTSVAQVSAAKNRIEAIIVENKSGRSAVEGRVFLDCTGDGDVAARAGIPFEKGRPSDGLMQPPTLLFRVGNVDIDAMMAEVLKDPKKYRLHNHVPRDYRPEDYHRQGRRFIFAGFDGEIKEARQRGEYPSPYGTMLFMCMPRENEIVANITKVHEIDGTNAGDLTRAEIELHRQVPGIIEFMRKYLPGFEQAYLISTAHQAGIRDTRRAKGLYTLTKEDMVASTEFADSIACGGYYIDIHNPRAGGAGNIGAVRLPKGYQIPYRCLVPETIDNLLLAGRCISVEWEAFGSSRVMAICMAVGQAAGTAAALAVRRKVSPRALEVAELQHVLRQQGACLYVSEARKEPPREGSPTSAMGATSGLEKGDLR